MNLPDITLVCIDCLNYNQAINAVKKSIEKIKFGRVLFFSDKIQDLSDNIEFIQIEKIKSKQEYSEFVFKKLVDYITTSHFLIIQYDGYILNPDKFNHEMLHYDYIGAPWWYDSDNVGNGGFSLRSKRLHENLQVLNFPISHPEDNSICRTYREPLEKLGIRFAPEHIAKDFSFEPNTKYKIDNYKYDTFGFHGIPKLILQ